MESYRPNVATPEGQQLGAQMARLCDGEMAKRDRDDRFETCAFRAGDHVANGSPETLMTALRCAMERTPFWCREHDRACAGWAVMQFPKGEEMQAPWDGVDGVDV